MDPFLNRWRSASPGIFHSLLAILLRGSHIVFAQLFAGIYLQTITVVFYARSLVLFDSAQIQKSVLETCIRISFIFLVFKRYLCSHEVQRSKLWNYKTNCKRYYSTTLERHVGFYTS